MNVKQELIDRCKKKKRHAQKELYTMLLPYLVAVVRRYLFDKSYEKDMLQESFVKIFENIDQYDQKKGLFHKWAVRITINTCLSHNSKRRDIIEDEFYIEVHDLPSEPLSYSGISNKKLLTLLDKMPQQYADIFNLFVIDEFNHKEIAIMLSITQDLSRKRLSRAKGWLRKYFNDLSENSSHKIIQQFFLN